jgi:hypothetical protein
MASALTLTHPCPNNRHTGTVVKLLETFGFVEYFPSGSSDGSKSLDQGNQHEAKDSIQVFFHYSQLFNTSSHGLKLKDEIEFDLCSDGSGIERY